MVSLHPVAPPFSNVYLPLFVVSSNVVVVKVAVPSSDFKTAQGFTLSFFDVSVENML